MLSPTHRTLHSRASAALAAAAFCTGAASAQSVFRVTNLVSDGAVPARHIDANLVNPWGIAFNPTGYVWVANAGTGTSTLYDGNGVPQDLVVFIPAPDGVPENRAEPTGIVYYGGNNFLVDDKNGNRGPARFIFATANGTIAAWAPDVNPERAITVVNSAGQEANYKGLAIATDSEMGDILFATDFHNGRVHAFTSTFQEIVFINGAFFDPDIPAGFAPFGIQTIDEVVYVTYAMQDDAREDEVTGPGLGYVNAFDIAGQLLGRIASEGPLNAPWGIAKAPPGFGNFGNALLIGNFGDGRITAFSPDTDSELGPLSGPDGLPIEIEGLWGIAFGNGLNNQPTDTLFFAAGIEDEAHGLYGSISSVTCYADQNGDGALDLFDFLAFVNAFEANDAGADCDADGALNLFDFLCFTNAFNAGC
jgi:uncharacterized protein (TIGR03118 family)